LKIILKKVIISHKLIYIKNMFIPYFFILLGFIYLLRNLGIIDAEAWGIIWPSVFIFIGFYILWKRYEWNCWREKIWHKLD